MSETLRNKDGLTEEEFLAAYRPGDYERPSNTVDMLLFTVADKDGIETAFEIYTDQEIVGDALLELGLIAGDEGPYGLFVKSVNGIVADYDEDSTYWAFYVNGEYAMSGVDVTKIEEDTAYMFKVEE